MNYVLCDNNLGECNMTVNIIEIIKLFHHEYISLTFTTTSIRYCHCVGSLVSLTTCKLIVIYWTHSHPHPWTQTCSTVLVCCLLSRRNVPNPVNSRTKIFVTMQDKRERFNTHNIAVVFSEMWSSSDINNQKWCPWRLIWSTFCTRESGKLLYSDQWTIQHTQICCRLLTFNCDQRYLDDH